MTALLDRAGADVGTPAAMVATPPGLMAWPLASDGEVSEGTDLALLALRMLALAGLVPEAGDIVAISQKIVSKAEGRWRDLDDITPGSTALALAARTGKDPRLVELVLSQSSAVVRAVPGVLIVRHRLGFVLANAGIDQSNTGRTGAQVLLLPEDPDRSAGALADRLHALVSWRPAVLVVDSFGRAWRRGVVGTAIGASGLACLHDRRGDRDRDGRVLAITEVARADALAAMAVLMMGEAAEGTPMVLIRGAAACPGNSRPQPATGLLRPIAEDLFP